MSAVEMASGDVEAHLAGAGLYNTELVRCGLAQIDDAPTVIRPAIVDLDSHCLPRLLVHHFDNSAEGQGLMRSGHRVLVINFPRGGRLAVESGSIPGRSPALIVAGDDGPGHEIKTARDKGGGNNGLLNQYY